MEKTECSFTTTSFHAWDSRVLDPNIFGDISAGLPQLHDLDEEDHYEVMCQIENILSSVIVDTINHYLDEQAPCAHYVPATSEIHACLNHIDDIDADEALELADADLEAWIEANSGPVGEAWREIESLVMARLTTTGEAKNPSTPPDFRLQVNGATVTATELAQPPTMEIN